jgi:hypothetical protein
MTMGNDRAQPKYHVAILVATHAVFSIFGLAVVPGYEIYFSIAVLLGLVAFFLLRTVAAKKALVLISIFSGGAGFFVRTVLGYSRHGWNGDVAFAALLVCILLAFAIAFLYQVEVVEGPGQ